MSAKKKTKPGKKAVKKKTTRKPAAKTPPKAKTTKKAASKPAKKTARARPKKAVKKAGKAAPKKAPVKNAKKKAARTPAAKAPPKAKTAAKVKVKATPKARTAAKVKVKAPPKAKTAGKVEAPAPASVAPAPAEATKEKTKKVKGRRRSSRRSQIIRRGPDGEILAPGDLLLPGGAKGPEEAQYLLRGSMAAEHPVAEEAINEILTKRGISEDAAAREELQAELDGARERFGKGHLEPMIPNRTNLKRTFQGVIDRARQRRREVGAFLRGLDMGQTETSHMDAHGEASLQSLMEWAARLENLVENLTEAPEANQAHYSQFHRVLDQLEASTEALIIDVEQTLRRLRDRLA